VVDHAICGRRIQAISAARAGGCQYRSVGNYNIHVFAHQFLRERFGSGSGSLIGLRCRATRFTSRDSLDRHAPRAQRRSAHTTSSFHYASLPAIPCDNAARLRQDLAACVPRWRTGHIDVPSSFPDSRKCLDHCDRHSAVGHAQHAILVLLARSGLRACGIVANYARMTNRLGRAPHRCAAARAGAAGSKCRCRGGRPAIAAYLGKGRPRCTQSDVWFIREHAAVAFANSSLSPRLGQRALADAGVARRTPAPYVFRHSLAT